METIKIDSVERKASQNGKAYFSISYNGGKKTSVFDETIGGFLEQKIGQNVQAEFKINGNFKNLIGVDFTGCVMPAPMIPEKTPLLDVRSTSIVAQVLLKEASNNINAYIESGVEIEQSKYEEMLCQNVQALASAYKVAVDALNG